MWCSVCLSDSSISSHQFITFLWVVSVVKQNGFGEEIGLQIWILGSMQLLVRSSIIFLILIDNYAKLKRTLDKNNHKGTKKHKVL